MGKPLSKEYKPDDERIATFRITHGKLTDFQKVCEKKGVSLSQALIGFIDSVIDGSNIPSPASQVVAIPDNVPTKGELESAIAELKENFANQIGDFKALVFSTAPTLTEMNAAIASLRSELMAEIEKK